jgi:transcriptional regulator with XRE-family HTH domain
MQKELGLETVDVGKRIKSIRKKKGLTLQELAEKSGISATAISAIERNVSSPTVSTLSCIGKALAESLSSLLGEVEIKYALTRAGDRKKLATGIRNVDFQSLASGIPGQKFHPMLSTLKPEATSGEDFINHRAEDFLFVIKGGLEVEMNGERIQLAEGDSLYFPGNVPYRWRNSSPGETQLLVVSTP